jgi:hypothetical protein
VIPFARSRDGAITARFTSSEAAMLRDLADQLVAMLLDRSSEAPKDPASVVFAQAGIGGGESAPLDPALARLLPDAYRGDADAASEHRHLTERSLIERKVANARRLADSLQSEAGPVAVRLDPDAVQAWLRTLTDLRLTLAARLEIIEDGDEGRIDDEDDAAMLAVYDWLGALQGTLIECLEAEWTS